MAEKLVLVAGASGLVGGAAIAGFAAAGWRVIGLSRREPASKVPGVEYRRVDLLDPASCSAAMADLQGVTHLVYAAVNETPGDLVASWTDPEHAARNGSMFAHLLDALLSVARALLHVTVIHGTKAYGVHLASRPLVPLRESLPRPPHDDFYFRQEDLLWSRQHGRSFHWTVLRAPIIAGGRGYGSNLNVLLAIGVFASLIKEQGGELPFPGGRDNLGVMEMVDVDLLASAIVWAAESPQARDQIFNVANGDVFVWPDLWPGIAGEFGLSAAATQPMSLRDAVFSRADLWRDLVRRHGLKAPEDPRVFLGESCALADFALGNCARTVLTSTVKIRRAGFHEFVDTADRVLEYFRRWRQEQILPPR